MILFLYDNSTSLALNDLRGPDMYGRTPLLLEVFLKITVNRIERPHFGVIRRKVLP
jgi:hypothetical protein